MKTLIIKSLLTSLYQRKGNFPSIKRGLRGVYPSLAKRGKGRFSHNNVLLMHSLVTPENYKFSSSSLILSFRLVRNLSSFPGCMCLFTEGFPTSGNDNLTNQALQENLS
jgi:hypothetical protein